MPFNFGAFVEGSSPPLVENPYDPLNKAQEGLPNWFVPLPATAPTKRNKLGGRTMPDSEARSLSEVNALQVEGHPSINLHLSDNKEAVVTVERRSQYWKYFSLMDKYQITQIQQEMLHAYQNFSNGSYSLAMLEDMGHPYGYGRRPGASAPAIRRRVPRRAFGRTIGNVVGVRGSVPTMTVINRQTGNLLASWHTRYEETEDGYILKFINGAKTPSGFPYAWALAVGTRKMQPHGPWTHVATMYLRRLNSAHMQAISRARQKALALRTMHWGAPSEATINYMVSTFDANHTEIV